MILRLATLLLLGASCVGEIKEASAGSTTAQGVPQARTPGAVDAHAVGPSGLRRLTRTEYDNALRDLLGDTSRPGWARLPEDAFDPFDNNYATQIASGVLVETLETMAEEAATRALADPTRRMALVGCAPTGPDDAACLRRFVVSFGRRALRRPLREEEVERYLTLQSYAVEDRNFHTAVALVIRAMLQDPEFVYAMEIGQAVPGSPGILKLNDFEMASRLSFFLLGAPPTSSLLDLAAAGKLATAADRRAAATKLLDSPAAKERVTWFHAQWLRYFQLPFSPELTAALRTETDALVQKVVFGKQDYFNLFRATETFLTDTLARHYGLPAPGSTGGAWMGYGASPRRGILSHGAFLAVGAKFDDTSPTVRGRFVREYLLCQDIPPPPPSVNADEPPPETGSPCKIDRYAEHTDVGCATCHKQIDPIGFGLEAYGRDGRFRTADVDQPQCRIKGDGEVLGVGTFNGPAGLADLLVKSGKLEACAVRQLYRFATGRKESAHDEPTIGRLGDLFARNGRSFVDLLVEIASGESFGFKRLEASP